MSGRTATQHTSKAASPESDPGPEHATGSDGNACGHDHHSHDLESGCGHIDNNHHEPADKTALISARSLWFSRGGRAILQGVDLDLRSGEIVTLIGPNGAGKTTLVRILLGLQPPDTGTKHQQADLRIGYVPQRFDIDEAIPLTVERFLQLDRKPLWRGNWRGWFGARGSGEASGSDNNASAATTSAVLGEVGAATLADRQLANLSGGELQRVLLARALLRDPGLLVLDEPVRGVDYSGEAELYDLIGRLRDARGLGILLVSHDLHVVMAQSDRVICLNGHVCCSGQPERVAQHPEYARLFGPQAARAFGLYRHSHDHDHDLSGRPIPVAAPASGHTDAVADSDSLNNTNKNDTSNDALNAAKDDRGIG